MTEKTVFTSPRIYYEIEKTLTAFSINVYMEGYDQSCDPQKCCHIKDFSEDLCKTEEFVNTICNACALPVHIRELAEEFLSV